MRLKESLAAKLKLKTTDKHNCNLYKMKNMKRNKKR